MELEPLYESDFTRHIQGLRHYIHDALGWVYSPTAKAPDVFTAMMSDGLLHSRSRRFNFRGRSKGHAYQKQAFELIDVTAVPLPKTQMTSNSDLDFTSIFDATANNDAGFRGVVISLDHHTRFLGKTIIRRDRGHYNPTTVNLLKRVGFASLEFERLFEVYSSDQVEAHALLTPDFMARMIDFDKDYLGRNIQCLFLGGKVYMALDIDDRFDFSKDFKASKYEDAATRITHEIGAIFYLLEKVQALQSRIGRNGKDGADKKRSEYYRTLLKTLRPAIVSAKDKFIPVKPRQVQSDYASNSWQHLLLQPRI